MIVAKEEETNEMFEKNLRILTPWLREMMLKIDDVTLWGKIQVEYNLEGYPVCRYRRGDQVFAITSAQPIRETETRSRAAADEAIGSVFLFGCGFGYPLFQLLEAKKPQTVVVVFEQDPCLFKAMLYYFDFEPIAQAGNFFFLIGDSRCFEPAFQRLLSNSSIFSCTHPTLYFTLPAQRNFKAEYEKICRYVFSQLSYTSFIMGNDHLDSLIGLRNQVENAPEILRAPRIGCLKDRFRNIPAFIVANGPSLDKNIRELGRIEGKGIILSVESAILPLMKNGIMPDILTAVERTEGTYTCHFQNRNYPETISLICLSLVDKRVFPSFPGPKIPVFRAGDVVCQWFDQYLGDGENSIHAGVNVSHLAAELAVYFGADPIVFVGQDYAYGPDRATHSKDSIYNQKRGKKAKENLQALPDVMVEGNNGSMIPTNWLWDDFRVGLENKIASHPDHLFLNATQGGAKIRGTRCEPLCDIIDKYCVGPLPRRVDQVIRESAKEVSPAKRNGRLADLIEDMERHEDLFHDFVSLTTQRKRECMRALRLADQAGPDEKDKILEEVYERNLAVMNQFAEDTICLAFTQQLFFAYDYTVGRYYGRKTPTQMTDVIKLQYNYFCYLNIVCESLTNNLENASKSLRAIREQMENQMEKQQEEAMALE